MTEKMEYINLGEIRHTQVSEEIVILSGKHTNSVTLYKAPEDGSSRGIVFIGNNSDDVTIGAFWEEFDRLQGLIKRPLDEPILPDDSPVVVGYTYVVDGKPTECQESFGTVRRWKFLCNEIRRCDIYGRINRLPLKKEEPTTMPLAINGASTPKNNYRKKKKTYKIKKVA